MKCLSGMKNSLHWRHTVTVFGMACEQHIGAPEHLP